VTDYSLGAITVSIFLLDHGSALPWLSLLDHGGMLTITVAVLITRLANRHASADRTDSNANFIRQHWRRHSDQQGGSKNRLPHLSFLQFERLENARLVLLFPRKIDVDKGNFFSIPRRLARQRAARDGRGPHRVIAEGRARRRGAQAD
jgi:hypothetical protein